MLPYLPNISNIPPPRNVHITFLNPFHPTFHGILHYDVIQLKTIMLTKWNEGMFISEFKNHAYAFIK